jgi:hypothetical protein
MSDPDGRRFRYSGAGPQETPPPKKAQPCAVRVHGCRDTRPAEPRTVALIRPGVAALNGGAHEPLHSTRIHLQSVQIRFQSAQIHSQSAQIRLQSTQIRFQSVQIRLQSAQIHSQSAQIRLQSTQIRFQSVQIHLQSAQIHLQSVQICFQSTQIRLQSAQIHSQSVQIRLQSVQICFQSTQIHLQFLLPEGKTELSILHHSKRQTGATHVTLLYEDEISDPLPPDRAAAKRHTPNSYRLLIKI